MASSREHGTAQSAITLYSIANCSFCQLARALLEARGLTYHEIDLGGNNAGRDALVKLTGRMSFPQIFMFEQLIGGYEDLAALLGTPAAR